MGQRDFRAGTSAPVYRSTSDRTLQHQPPIRRDLIDRRRYLVPNSIVVTRGCPQHCDFCYKDAFYESGRSFGESSNRSGIWSSARINCA